MQAVLDWAWSTLEEKPPAPGEGYVPPSAVRAAAYEGLTARRENELIGMKRPGGTDVGVARAFQLLYADAVPYRSIKRMRSFFRRHASNDRSERGSTMWTAWALWGGDAGRRWAEAVYEQETKQ